MKIAFVGKGGAGKSTLTTLFLRHLAARNSHDILAIDADLNMNLAGQLGVSVQPDTLLARPDVADVIRTHLKGTNTRITDINQFLPTTPPGEGSNVITDVRDAALAPFTAIVSDNPAFRLLTVGTYDADGIGQTCYHSHLFVAENLLSHIVTPDNMAVVCDMVAGTDAFAYSLHLQFDAIVLICEPTPESAQVCKMFIDLAAEAGMSGLVHLVGNKVEDADDVAFITSRTGRSPLGAVPVIRALKKARQDGAAITHEMLPENLQPLMDSIIAAAEKPSVTESQRMEKLRVLHAKLNDKKWVQLAYGDVMGQIDPDYNSAQAAQNSEAA